MKNNGYKFLLITLLPILLLALSPMRGMICTQKMEECPPCCHEMSVEKSSSEAQILSLDDCCIMQSSEGITAISSLQKIEEVCKKKFHSLGLVLPYLDSHSLQNRAKPNLAYFHPSAFPPHPDLVLIKNSFLI